jgi:hypothetical protein
MALIQPCYGLNFSFAQGTVKKRKERRIILFGKSEEHKQAWLKDLQYCLWGANGKKGPDPSKSGATHGMNPPRTTKYLFSSSCPCY